MSAVIKPCVVGLTVHFITDEHIERAALSSNTALPLSFTLPSAVSVSATGLKAVLEWKESLFTRKHNSMTTAEAFKEPFLWGKFKHKTCNGPIPPPPSKWGTFCTQSDTAWCSVDPLQRESSEQNTCLYLTADNAAQEGCVQQPHADEASEDDSAA